MVALLTSILVLTSPVTLPSSLTGSWIGTLEYRDFSDNSRERLPTLLRVYRPEDGAGLVFRYVFDDGPTKVVQSRDLITIDAGHKTYTVTSMDDKSVDVYTLGGLDKLSPDGAGSVLLTGKGTENGRQVEVRQTLTVSTTALRILRETRLPGEAFQFRHAFAFTRVTQPAGSR